MFSVIITSFNYKHFIIESINSALTQRYQPAEIIVVDDGSTDGTIELLQETYGSNSRIQVLSQPNGGQCSAFITGVAAATQDFICFLDADDIWTTDYLEVLSGIYKKTPTVDFIFCNLQLFGDSTGNFFECEQSRNIGQSRLRGAYHSDWQCSPTSAISIRRTKALKILDLPAPMIDAWRVRADDCLGFGADILGCNKYYLAQPLVKYRVHKKNNYFGSQINPEETLNYWIRNEQMLDYYRNKSSLTLAQKKIYLRHAKLEFRAKPEKIFRDRWIYARLAMSSDMRLTKRLEHFFSILFGH